MRAFGKDRAPETKAPARSITAAVPTPLGPPVGCHPTPSDGIAHANPPTGISVGKGLSLITYTGQRAGRENLKEACDRVCVWHAVL